MPRDHVSSVTPSYFRPRGLQIYVRKVPCQLSLGDRREPAAAARLVDRAEMDGSDLGGARGLPRRGVWKRCGHGRIPLEAIAAGAVDELTFIAGLRGKPLVKEAFATWFRRACDGAGLKGKSSDGVRKAAAMADGEAGWPDAELDAKFGWTGREMAAHHTRAANRER